MFLLNLLNFFSPENTYETFRNPPEKKIYDPTLDFYNSLHFMHLRSTHKLTTPTYKKKFSKIGIIIYNVHLSVCPTM